MRIPESNMRVAGVRYENGRLQAPAGAGSDVVDTITLANRELEANDRLATELKGLDNSAADQDSRVGSVRLGNYASKATGQLPFSSIAMDGNKLTAQALGRSGNAMDCRQVDGPRLSIASDYGLPGAVPGLRFNTYPDSADGSTVTLSSNYSRPEMVMRMTRADLQAALVNLPENSGVNGKLLGKQLAKASGQDFLALQDEFSSKTMQALKSNVGMLSKGTAYMLAVTGLSAALNNAGMTGLAVGVFAGGLLGGYGAIKLNDHKSRQGFQASSELFNLQMHLEKNATELPASISG